MSYIIFSLRLIFVFFVFIFFVFASDVKNKRSIENMVLISSNVYYPLFKTEFDVFFPIEVDSFYIDKYPVTNGEFLFFLKKKTDWNKKKIKSLFADENYLNHWDLYNFIDIVDKPVTNVSWFAANEFCNFYGKRLPTVVEWESVGYSSEFSSIGNGDPAYLINILNWYVGEKDNYLIKIQNMKKNYWGIFGMNGIIWEWVEDFSSVIMLNVDAEGGELEEVLYCGAVATKSIDPTDYAAFMRFAFRNSLKADYTMSSLGFRCVKSVN